MENTEFHLVLSSNHNESLSSRTTSAPVILLKMATSFSVLILLLFVLFAGLVNVSGYAFFSIGTRKPNTRPTTKIFVANSGYIIEGGRSVPLYHDEIGFRVTQYGLVSPIPQPERYRTEDWVHHLRTLPMSRLLYRIRNVVLTNTIWSFFVWFAFKMVKKCTMNSPGSRLHSLLGSCLGLLLVFRTNSSYQRFWEGRKIFEYVLTNCRHLACNLIAFNQDLFGTENNIKALERALGLVCAFPVTLEEHVRGCRKSSELSALLIPSDIEDLDRVANRPLFIVSRLTEEIKKYSSKGDFSSRDRQNLQRYTELMGSCIGSSERIVQTPVPLTYARHTSRFLSLFCLTAPIALVGEIGWLVIPFSSFLAWALFGIQEIGLLIEDPFDGALKLSEFSETLRRDVKDLLLSAKIQDLGSTTFSYQEGSPFLQLRVNETAIAEQEGGWSSFLNWGMSRRRRRNNGPF